MNDKFDELSVTIRKFEAMLKTNNIYFFDSTDFEEIIDYYIENGKLEKAKKACEMGLSQHTDNEELLILKAELYILEDRLIEGLELLNKLEKNDPNNIDVYIHKATVYSKLKEHKRAILSLDKAIELEDESANDLYALKGKEYIYLDDFQSAKVCFFKSLAIDNVDYTALYNVIYCFDALSDTIGAIDFLNIYLEKNPYCEIAWHQLGKQYTSKKMYDEALASYEFAIISDEQFAGAYIEKGKILQTLKRYNEAIESFKLSIAFTDSSAYVLSKLGKCYLRLGCETLAEKCFNESITIDPYFSSSHYKLAQMAVSKQMFSKALLHIEKAIGADVNKIKYQRLKGNCLFLMQDFKTAAEAFQKLIDLGNTSRSSYINLMDSLLLTKSKKTNAIIGKTLGLFPDDKGFVFRKKIADYLQSKVNGMELRASLNELPLEDANLIKSRFYGNFLNKREV